MTQALKQLFICGSLLLLAACANAPLGGERTAASLTPLYPESANYYLQQAASSPAPERDQQLLNAAGKLLQDGMQKRAEQVIQEIDTKTLTATLQQQYALTQARLQLLKRQPQKATLALANLKPSQQLNPIQQREYYAILATAYARRDMPLTSVQERIKLDKLLPKSAEATLNRRDIWQTLQTLSPATLQAAALELPDNELKAWLQLAYYAKTNNRITPALINHLTQWQQANPNHPGNQMLAASLQQVDDNLYKAPQKIALLLPMTGSLAGAGSAIRDGFMSAYYEHAAANQHAVTIKVIDTADSNNIQALYQQAIDSGAQLIVGPLTKQNVAAIAELKAMSVPTVALNYLDKPHKTAANFYQFGLAPEDEAGQVAQKAFIEGHRRALVIAPATAWGERVVNAFNQKWQALGGKTIGELDLKRSDKTATQLKRFLGVSGSQARSRTLKRVLGDKLHFTPRRRQDADMIFMVANPARAREIKPLLNFYYAGNLPVFATSDIYAGHVARQQDHDINGVQFCDMPWVLTPDAFKQFDRGGRNARRHPRLYAMGLDAYTLSEQLNRLRLFPEFNLAGATGRLYLLSNHKIYRGLDFAQFKNGRATQTLKEV
jgi:uncharacterized protein